MNTDNFNMEIIHLETEASCLLTTAGKPVGDSTHILRWVKQTCKLVYNPDLHGIWVFKHSGQLRMAQGSTCMECVCWHSKLIIACACVNQLYIKGYCIN